MQVLYKFLFFSLLIYTSSFSQDELKFSHLTMEDGLSQSTIGVILEDKYGFIWFGTQAGLNRYDGYEFVVFKNNPDDSLSISNDYIRALYEDKEGCLWIGTQNGLNYYNPRQPLKGFKKYFHNPQDITSLSGNQIYSIYEDKEGILWIGTFDGGLNKFDKKTQKFISYQHNDKNPKSISDNSIWCIKEDKKGKLYIGTLRGGLNIFDKKTETFTYYLHNPKNPNSINYNNVQALWIDNNDRVWIGMYGGGVDILYTSSEKFIHIPPSQLTSNKITFILGDTYGRLWFATDNGGLNVIDIKEYPHINPQTKFTFRNYKNNPFNSQSLASDRIMSIYEDKNGRLWFGLLASGIDKLDKNFKQIYHYKHNPKNLSSLINNGVWAFCEDIEKRIWIGTSSGISILQNNEMMFHYQHKPNNSYSLHSNTILSLLSSYNGDIWIGTQDGLSQFDGKTKKFKNLNNSKTFAPIKNSYVGSLFEDSKKNIWIGTWNGLYEYNTTKNTFIGYKHDLRDSTTIHSNIILCIEEKNDSLLWIGTNEGINVMNILTKKFTKIPQVVNSYIIVLYKDKEENIWIGTASEGIYKYEHNTQRFLHYGEKEGIPDNTIYSIVEDNSKNIWISTNKGITKFNPQTLSAKTYTQRDGLQADEFNRLAGIKKTNGELFFGGINGFNRFFPEKIKENPHIPPVYITSIKKFNTEVKLPTSTFLTDSLQFNYDDYVLSFQFTSLDFTSPRDNQYAYALEGFDKEWTYSGNRRFATYTNLNPGEYIFRVKASNNDGVWNEKGTSLHITILPPFWQTWIFKISVLCVTLLGLYSIYRWRVYAVQSQNKKLEKIVSERTKELEEKNIQISKQNSQLQELNEKKNEFIGIISHDLRNPLTIIMSYAKILVKEIEVLKNERYTKMLQRIMKSSEHTKRLVDEMLDISAIEAGNIRLQKSNINLVEIIDECIEVYNTSAMNKNIQIHYGKNISFPNIQADKTRLIEVIENLLSNAIKYTYQGGSIIISHETASNFITTHIKDTGQGLDENDLKEVFSSYKKLSAKPTGGETSTGLGLAITKKIVEAHKGKIWLTSEKGKGATFSFSLPLN